MRRTGGLALLLALSLPHPAQADYKDSYRKGIEALDRKRWDDVARHMKEAITSNPAEGERIKLYGLRFEPYFPHFYLGAAYLNLGNCDAAVKAFEASRAQGAIRSNPKYAELVDGLKSCEGQVAVKPTTAPPSTTAPKPAGPGPAVVAAAVQAAEAALARADESARGVAVLAADALLAPVWSREPALGRAEAEGKEGVATARAKFEAARRASDPAQLAEARDLAARANERLDGVRQAAERRRDALRTVSIPSTAPAGPTTTLPAPAARMSPELLNGARAYFEGRYAEALRYLSQTQGQPPRAMARSHLLRAAARFSLFRSGGERDARLSVEAAHDVAACRKADPNLAPDPNYFSPAFSAFFKSH